MRLAVLMLSALAGCGRAHFDEQSDAMIDAAIDAEPDAVPAPTFTQQTLTGTVPTEVFDILPISSTAYVAVADQGIWRSSGDGTWTRDPFTPYTLYGTFRAGSDLYVVGNTDAANKPVIGRVTATSATHEDPIIMRPLNDGWSSSATDVYTVGYSGSILHSQGDAVWTGQTSGVTTRLNAIWGSAANDIYAAGDVGTILHSTGDGTWTAQASGVGVTLLDVWGSGPNDIYVVGYGGTILHSIGDGTWTRQTTAATHDLLGVFGDAGLIYAVGRSASVLRSSGDGTWTAFPTGITLQQLDAVASDGNGGLFWTGQPGIILHSP